MEWVPLWGLEVYISADLTMVQIMRYLLAEVDCPLEDEGWQERRVAAEVGYPLVGSGVQASPGVVPAATVYVRWGTVMARVVVCMVVVYSVVVCVERARSQIAEDSGHTSCSIVNDSAIVIDCIQH